MQFDYIFLTEVSYCPAVVAKTLLAAQLPHTTSSHLFHFVLAKWHVFEGFWELVPECKSASKTEAYALIMDSTDNRNGSLL